jgi:Reverse transcriptase (RNA-dependent DNA polymerase)
LDLSKAFDMVDQERLKMVMVAYGFGNRAMRFFEDCWDGSIVAPRAAGVYSPRVLVRAGVRQGDVISPLLFNIVVGAILRWTDKEKPELLERVQKIFYADDGRIAGEDGTETHEELDFVADGFERMALEVSTRKPVLMTNRFKFRNTNIAYSAKLRVQLHVPEYRDRWKRMSSVMFAGKSYRTDR